MSIFEQPSTSRAGSRFGKLSPNMFFARNTAHPKRVRHIEGLNGVLVCNVNDDPSVIRSPPASVLSFNKSNSSNFETPRRAERLIPPTGFWNTYGVVHDTDRWKQELASLASASGLGVEKHDHYQLHQQMATADQQHASRSGAHYSTRTGRFNEGTAKSRGRTGSKHTTAFSETLFNVSESEREMWMLQVLCQLLGTSSLEDVQSWLVSAPIAEKEQARNMINSALRGLKESERSSNLNQQSVDLDSLSNFVEKRKTEEKSASNKYIQEALNRSVPILPSVDEEQQSNDDFNESWNGEESNNTFTNLSPQNLTTYKRAYQNYNQRSHSSFDGASTVKKNSTFHESKQNREEDQNSDFIDTIQLDDDRRRVRSATSTKVKSDSNKLQTQIDGVSSNHDQKHRIESIEFNDDGTNLNTSNVSEIKMKSHHDENNDDHEQKKEYLSSSFAHKSKLFSIDENQSKTRKIRELQNKLSRQEEESKKKFSELQSKQSRLENAIKLLLKQTSTYNKRRQNKQEDVEDLDAPVVNVIIQSPREHTRRNKSNEIDSLGQQQDMLAVASRERPKKHHSSQNNARLGDYDVQDVKVQINLSRLDNHGKKVFSGIWKPDTSTLHRLQGN